MSKMTIREMFKLEATSNKDVPNNAQDIFNRAQKENRLICMTHPSKDIQEYLITDTSKEFSFVITHDIKIDEFSYSCQITQDFFDKINEEFLSHQICTMIKSTTLIAEELELRFPADELKDLEKAKNAVPEEYNKDLIDHYFRIRQEHEYTIQILKSVPDLPPIKDPIKDMFKTYTEDFINKLLDEESILYTNFKSMAKKSEPTHEDCLEYTVTSLNEDSRQLKNNDDFQQYKDTTKLLTKKQLLNKTTLLRDWN